MHLILRNEHSYTITKNERIQSSQDIGFSAKVKKSISFIFRIVPVPEKLDVARS